MEKGLKSRSGYGELELDDLFPGGLKYAELRRRFGLPYKDLYKKLAHRLARLNQEQLQYRGIPVLLCQ